MVRRLPAMAGLANLVPRYLPRYGMAPEMGQGGPALVGFGVIAMFVRIASLFILATAIVWLFMEKQ